MCSYSKVRVISSSQLFASLVDDFTTVYNWSGALSRALGQDRGIPLHNGLGPEAQDTKLLLLPEQNSSS